LDQPHPTGLKPNLRQMMIVILWSALLTAATRALIYSRLLGTTPESLCQNIPIYLGIYPMPILAGLLWVFDRPGAVRNWCCSNCMIAACFLGGVVYSLCDPICYVLAGKTTIIFPMWPIMWPIMGLVGFWCGWKQWQTARARDCPACGRRSIIPIAVATRLGSKRKFNTGKHGWCASCGANCERN
jgi:hypothetical protein